MLTIRQMRELPAGEYSNTKLQKMFPNHCVGKGLKPDFAMEKKDNTMIIAYIKNRQQRRKRTQLF